MSSEAPTQEAAPFGLVRLLVSTLVLIAVAAGGWVLMFGVPEGLTAGAGDNGTAPTGTSTPAGDNDTSGDSAGGLAAPPATAVPVRTAIARRADLVMRITATGNAEALQELTVTPSTQGPIVEMAVGEGDVVEAGDLLVRLDDADQQLAAQRSREQLVSAISSFQVANFMDGDTVNEGALQELDQAQTDLLAGLRSTEQFRAVIDDPRFESLFESISRDEVMAARNGLLGAYASYNEAQLNLDRTRVTAPFGGQIANVEAVLGERVSAGTELMTLVATDPIRVRVDVLESQAGLVRPGREARVHFAAYPSETFRGRVETISPIVDHERKTLEVIVQLPNPDLRLKPGMFAQIGLDTEILRDRLLVPRSAVLLRDERPMLFVVRDGRSQWIYIRQGLDNGTMVEVLEGVEPGDEVIIDGHYSLAHDAPVRVVEDDEALPDDQG